MTEKQFRKRKMYDAEEFNIIGSARFYCSTEWPNGDPAGHLACDTIEECIDFLKCTAHMTYISMWLLGEYIEIYDKRWGTVYTDLLNLENYKRSLA